MQNPKIPQSSRAQIPRQNTDTSHDTCSSTHGRPRFKVGCWCNVVCCSTQRTLCAAVRTCT